MCWTRTARVSIEQWASLTKEDRYHYLSTMATRDSFSHAKCQFPFKTIHIFCPQYKAPFFS